MTKRRKIYWDACIWLAWLHNEPNEQSVIDGIEQTVDQVDKNIISLITSVITRTEILENRITPEVRKTLDALFNRRNVTMINLDHRISDLSHEIRDYYDKIGTVLGTTDCQHLATAIIHGADEFHTLDGGGKKKKGKLLPLDGVIANKYKMKICKPYCKQGWLFRGPK